MHSRHGRGNDKLWITRATRVADVYPRHVNMCIGVVPRKCAQKYAYTWFRPADPVADDLHAVAQRQLASHRTTTFPPQTLSILAVVHCPRLCAPFDASKPCSCSFVRFLGGSLLSRWIGFPTRGRRIGDKMVWSGSKWFEVVWSGSKTERRDWTCAAEWIIKQNEFSKMKFVIEG